MVKKDKVIMR